MATHWAPRAAVPCVILILLAFSCGLSAANLNHRASIIVADTLDAVKGLFHRVVPQMESFLIPQLIQGPNGSSADSFDYFEVETIGNKLYLRGTSGTAPKHE